MPSFTELHDRGVSCTTISMSPAMDIVAIGGSDGSVTLYRWVSWQRIVAVAEADASPATALAWSPDGHMLAILRCDGSLHILPVERSATVVSCLPTSDADACGALCWATWISSTTSIPVACGQGQGKEAYAAVLPPEPLPVGLDESALPFVTWDSDRVSDVARVLSASGLPQAHVTNGSAWGRRLGRPAQGQEGSLASAASAIAASASAIALAGSTRGMCHPCLPGAGPAGDPAAALVDTGAATAVQVLAVLQERQGQEPLLSLLALGTIPILSLSLPLPTPLTTPSSAPLVPVRVSLASDLGSVVTCVRTRDAHVVSVLDTRACASTCAPGPPPLTLPPLFPCATTALTRGDAVLRQAAAAVSLLAGLWEGVHTAMVGAARGLESEVAKADLLGGGALGDAARGYYPHSPAPLAAAEVHRQCSVGAINAGFGAWLEAGIGDAGLVKLSRSVEGGLAGLEAVAVTRAARDLEVCLVAIGDFLTPLLTQVPSVGQGGGMGGVASLGWSVEGFEALAAEVTHACALLQSVRTCAAHARAVYSALATHWRVTLKGWTLAAARAQEAGQALQGPSRPAPALYPSDSTLVRASVQPAAVPTAIVAGIGGGGGGGMDPLGLGFSTAASSSSDPLGLGFSSRVSTAPPPAPISPPTHHDVFLPYSLTALIMGACKPGEGEAAVPSFLGRATVMPMSAYPFSLSLPSAHAAFLCPPARHRSLGEQVVAILERWRALVSLPCLTLSAAVAGSMAHVSVAVPFAAEGGGGTEPSPTSGIVRTPVSAAFDDRWEGVEGVECVQPRPGSAHIAVLPLPLPGRVLLLCIPLPTPSMPVPVHAAVLMLDGDGEGEGDEEGGVLLASAWHGPPPGTCALSSATIAGLGFTFLPHSAVPSDGDRALCLLIGSRGGGQPRLVKVPHTKAKWVPVPPGLIDSPTHTLAEWASLHAPVTRVTEISMGCRPGVGGLERKGGGGAGAVLDVCGPRGGAVVVVGPPHAAHMRVLDLAEEEEEEVETG